VIAHRAGRTLRTLAIDSVDGRWERGIGKRFRESWLA
jgi:hypothetical protein